jgi:Flp pilus assembly protein TadG
MRRPRRSTQERDRGQAAVELALALPVVVVVAVFAAQVGALGLRQLAISHAAREAARAAAISADPVGAGTAAALAATGVRPLEVDVSVGGTVVTVTVHHRGRIGIGPLGRDVDLVAAVTMRLEPP